MSDIRQFTISILNDITKRLGGRNSSSRLTPKEMISLESLLKKDKQPASKASPIEAASTKKQVITEKDINSLTDVEEFIVYKGDIVTPLAKDLLRKKRIKLLVK